MATKANPTLQHAVIYSVFVRNHTPEGTFRALVPDLPRIRALGVDYVWLLPIHPIGQVARKGTLGSPYAIRDYRAVNPEYGTLEDFVALVDAIHEQGMGCLIDVVYNHTSPDSVLFDEHPEFFYRTAEGLPGNRVGDWTDIIDLDYGVSALWEYQIETLCQWAHIVDGFRCDVASLVPVAFWEQARREVSRVRPSTVWLAETTHRSLGTQFRRRGMYCARDAELFGPFDMEYAYDVQETFDAYLDGMASLTHYLDLLDFEDCVYPENHNKLRFLENHDQPRIASRVTSPLALVNHTAFLYFQKGATLLYAGQEVASTHTPSLFERDTIRWDTGTDLSALIRTLSSLAHEHLEADDVLSVLADDKHHIAVLYRDGPRNRKVGVFSLQAQAAHVAVDLADGTYANLIDGTKVVVRNGLLDCSGSPLILMSPRT